MYFRTASGIRRGRGEAARVEGVLATNTTQIPIKFKFEKSHPVSTPQIPLKNPSNTIQNPSNTKQVPLTTPQIPLNHHSNPQKQFNYTANCLHFILRGFVRSFRTPTSSSSPGSGQSLGSIWTPLLSPSHSSRRAVQVGQVHGSGWTLWGPKHMPSLYSSMRGWHALADLTHMHSTSLYVCFMLSTCLIASFDAFTDLFWISYSWETWSRTAHRMQALRCDLAVLRALEAYRDLVDAWYVCFESPWWFQARLLHILQAYLHYNVCADIHQTPRQRAWKQFSNVPTPTRILQLLSTVHPNADAHL